MIYMINIHSDEVFLLIWCSEIVYKKTAGGSTGAWIGDTW
jgi:hypothetical protein